MPVPAIRLTGLRATLDAEAAAHKQLKLRVEAGVLYLSPAGVAGLLPPHVPLTLDGLRGGRLQLRLTWRGVAVQAEVLPEGTSAGNLRLRVTGLRAGLLPLPSDAVGLLLSIVGKLPKGIYAVDNRTFEIHLGQLAGRIGLELPPLKRVTVNDQGAELDF